MATLVATPQDVGSRGLTSREANGGSRDGKRTFKEKLHGLIAEAEAAEAQAYREAQLADKKSLCIQLLVEGRPQAFVDFFSLTHNGTPAPPLGLEGGESTSGQDEDVPQEALGLLRVELLKADNALRTGDTQAVYAAYKNLAKYFAQIGRLQKAEFFFRRCLRLSQDTQWLAGELEANLALGVVYEELQQTEAAIECYERRLSLAQDHALGLEKDTAYANLTAVYLRQAEVQEGSGPGMYDAAIASYNKCLSAAERSGDMATAAKANYRIGMLYKEQAKHPEAIHYLRQFIELAPHMPDKAAVGTAYTAFSACLKEMGDAEGAVRCLEEYLQLARGGDQHGTALASCALGIALYEQGDLDGAVSYFEKFFETARTLSDRRMLDTARVNLGVARGALRMGSWMQVVASNLPKLIAWKGSRVPFTDH
ncbi:hypothetical protein HYH03_017031 [Edaphochlamys debaryana]|uniref:Tetratricopeptide repeat protein 29 n=1 Tax=Edaphochlamys debaryana TaxID=47281 RepID=A0A836BPJ5_9CHLO|nr:hypothetical protein HYH03_017031 [Edaphochlamys debaryana]|eukprot:KAG2484150.1 hypothetical protein HYH03_017031 [Edaphochlamys debaryana]